MRNTPATGQGGAGIVNAGDREHREVVTTNRRADGGKKGSRAGEAGRAAGLAGARSRGVRPRVPPTTYWQVTRAHRDLDDRDAGTGVCRPWLVVSTTGLA